jgi:cytoskeleton protein RodZ
MVVESRLSDIDGEPVGVILKEARENLGLSLDDAARVTRIGKGYLQALEDGTYNRLPSVVYAKGFLRAYATYLKLPENEIVQLYERDSWPTHDCQDEAEMLGEGSQNKKKPVLPSARRMFVIASLLITAAVAYYLISNFPFVKEVNERSENLTVATPPEAKPEGPSLPPEQAAGVENSVPEQNAATEKQEEPDEKAPDSIPAVSKGMVLKIRVVEDGWLDITIDDTITQHYDLKTGDLIEWKGEKGFTLDIGNSGGVQAELNGKPLKAFGTNGETTHVVLKAGDIQP